jgi:hypothetical protein
MAFIFSAVALCGPHYTERLLKLAQVAAVRDPEVNSLVHGGFYLPLHPENTTFLDFAAGVTKVVTALADSNGVGTRQTNDNTSPPPLNSRKNQNASSKSQSG